jgi:uncharacterized membrane protein
MAASAAQVGQGRGRGPNFTSVATTIGAVAVGAALFEAALIPGIVIGAAALLAPDMTSKVLPKLGRGVQSLFRRPAGPAKPASAAKRASEAPLISSSLLPRIQVGQALAKTVSFRIIVATLDFGWNYIILGELTTAAGLSALNLMVGPFFYFLHEAIWNYVSVPDPHAGPSEPVTITILSADGSAPLVQVGKVKVSRALAKTVVYEVMGATAEFTVNLLVVGDVATAAIITAPLVIFGPFIYYGHEKAWEYFAARASVVETHPA